MTEKNGMHKTKRVPPFTFRAPSYCCRLDKKSHYKACEGTRMFIRHIL